MCFSVVIAGGKVEGERRVGVGGTDGGELWARRGSLEERSDDETRL